MPKWMCWAKWACHEFRDKNMRGYQGAKVTGRVGCHQGTPMVKSGFNGSPHWVGGGGWPGETCEVYLCNITDATLMWLGLSTLNMYYARCFHLWTMQPSNTCSRSNALLPGISIFPTAHVQASPRLSMRRPIKSGRPWSNSLLSWPKERTLTTRLWLR
jgi:hypothetical protein